MKEKKIGIWHLQTIGSTWRGIDYLTEQLAKHDFFVRVDAQLSRKLLNDNKSTIDIIHIHWPIAFYAGKNLYLESKHMFEFMYFLVYMKRKGYKIVWTVHNLLPHDRVFPFYFGNLFLAHCADALIVHGEDTRKKIKKVYGISKNVFTIPLGNDEPFYDGQYSKIQARKELHLPQNQFVYLFLGHIRNYKGVDILMKAYAKANLQNSLLIIAGSPYDARVEEEIIALSTPTIKLDLRKIPSELVQQYMAACDVVVTPYRKITTSAMVSLALTFGKPIITTRRGTVPEYVNEKCAMIIDSHDDLPQALRDIQKKDLKEMSTEARKMSKKCDWKIVVKKYEEVYELLMNN